MITQEQLKEIQERVEALYKYLDIPQKPMEYEEGDSSKELSRAINKCLWGPINDQMLSFTEGMSLSEFSQKCGNQMTNGWDMYII